MDEVPGDAAGKGAGMPNKGKGKAWSQGFYVNICKPIQI